MLEVAREDDFGEGVGVPDDEAVAGEPPGHDGVGVGVVDDVVRLAEERRRAGLAEALHRPRRELRPAGGRPRRRRLRRRAGEVDVEVELLLLHNAVERIHGWLNQQMRSKSSPGQLGGMKSNRIKEKVAFRLN